MMTLWERLRDTVKKINADNGKGLSIKSGTEGIVVTKDYRELQQGARPGIQQRIMLTAEEVQWLSNQFTRIFAEEEKPSAQP